MDIVPRPLTIVPGASGPVEIIPLPVNIVPPSSDIASNTVSKGSGPIEQKQCNGQKLITELIASIKKKIKKKNKINLVCYVDDPACDKYASIIEDDEESQNRTKIIRKAMIKYGLIDWMGKIGSINVRKYNLFPCHDKQYVETIFNCGRMNRPIKIPGPSSQISMRSIDSLEGILAAIASVMGAIDTVCSPVKLSGINTASGKFLSKKCSKMYHSKKVNKVFCNVRPPGHRAHYKKGSEHCFFNNVAVAAKFAMIKYPAIIRKVLIFDWGLACGDGTENIFQNNPDVMFVSFHAHKPELDGFQEPDGKKIENVYKFPITGDETIESYMDKFNNKFLPLAHEFKPDLVMISAGFDSHKDDPCHVLPLDYGDYHEMTKGLMKVADTWASGRLVSVLEAGYELNVLFKSVIVHIATMIDGY
jgi:acetoin utilization deacetylase AcuC-like enzyme